MMFLIFIASVVISLLLIGTALFQLLWNLTMPRVFGLRQIGFWIAFRLLLMAGILSSGGLVKFNLGG
jgi:Ca2+/H+ antiporter, TMEM165/GDT1 family